MYGDYMDGYNLKNGNKYSNKRIRRKRLFVGTATVLAAGVVFITSGTIKRSQKVVTDNSYIENAFASSNGDALDSLEKVLGVKYDSEYKEDVNSIGSALKFVKEYESAEEKQDKVRAALSLSDVSDDVEEKALSVLKSKIADEHGVNFEDVTIRVNAEDGNFAVIKGQGSIKLKGEEFNLSDDIANLQGFNTLDLSSSNSAKNYVAAVKNVCLDSVRFIDNKKDKERFISAR